MNIKKILLISLISSSFATHAMYQMASDLVSIVIVGMTSYATNKNLTYLDLALKKESFSYANTLIQDGNVILINPNKYLDMACSKGNLNILKFLIKNGANINAKKSLIRYEYITEIPVPIFEKIAKRYKEGPIGKYLKKLTQNQKELIRLITVLKESFTKNDVVSVQKLINDPHTPPYAIQKALPVMLEIHKKHPQIVSKNDLIRIYKKIPFNKMFMNNALFKDAIKFAATETIEDTNARITDNFGRTIEKACILFGEDKNRIEEVVSNTFCDTNLYNSTSRVEFIKTLNNQPPQDNPLLKMISDSKSRINNAFYLNLMNMTYLNLVLSKSSIPSEITGKIASYVDRKSLKELVKKMMLSAASYGVSGKVNKPNPSSPGLTSSPRLRRTSRRTVPSIARSEGWAPRLSSPNQRFGVFRLSEIKT